MPKINAPLAVLLLIPLLAAPPARGQPFAPSNPLRFQGVGPRSEVRDPCIIRDGDAYYLVFTVFPFRNREESHLADENQGSSPGIKLFKSTDLKTWTFDRWLVKSSELPENSPYKHRFWAPEIHKIGGKFYLIFTADNWLKKEFNPAGTWGTAGYAFVGVADKIDGPYEHITYIKGAACDTTLFEDADGKTYAFIPRGNIDVQQIDLSRLAEDKVELIGKPRKIISSDNADIGMAEHPTYLEGPWVIRDGKRYVAFYAGPYKDKSGKDAGYWTGAAYADNVLGPWTKDPRGKVFLGGHLATFDASDGQHLFSYRGEQRANRGFLCIDKFDIDADGHVKCGEPTIAAAATPPLTIPR